MIQMYDNLRVVFIFKKNTLGIKYNNSNILLLWHDISCNIVFGIIIELVCFNYHLSLTIVLHFFPTITNNMKFNGK